MVQGRFLIRARLALIHVSCEQTINEENLEEYSELAGPVCASVRLREPCSQCREGYGQALEHQRPSVDSQPNIIHITLRIGLQDNFIFQFLSPGTVLLQ